MLFAPFLKMSWRGALRRRLPEAVFGARRGSSPPLKEVRGWPPVMKVTRAANEHFRRGLLGGTERHLWAIGTLSACSRDMSREVAAGTEGRARRGLPGRATSARLRLNGRTSGESPAVSVSRQHFTRDDWRWRMSSWRSVGHVWPSWCSAVHGGEAVLGGPRLAELVLGGPRGRGGAGRATFGRAGARRSKGARRCWVVHVWPSWCSAVQGGEAALGGPRLAELVLGGPRLAELVLGGPRGRGGAR